MCSTMQKINNEDCQQASGGDLLTQRMFCALSNTTSACVGDSGSPLIFNGSLFGKFQLPCSRFSQLEDVHDIRSNCNVKGRNIQ